jgi:hypothetical protein
MLTHKNCAGYYFNPRFQYHADYRRNDLKITAVVHNVIERLLPDESDQISAESQVNKSNFTFIHDNYILLFFNLKTHIMF